MKNSSIFSFSPWSKGLAIILAFLVVGEAMLRFDEAVMPFGETRTITLVPRLGETGELQSVNAGVFSVNQDDLRVMVLGDSYMHGGGIAFDENISHRLKQRLLSENRRYREVHVLDVTRSNNNALDNATMFWSYLDRFQPQVVVLGYTNSDIQGELNAADPGDQGARPEVSSRPRGKAGNSLIRKVYRFLYKSKTVHYVMSTVHREMKQLGFVVPGSEFHAILRAYAEDRPNWVRTKEIMAEMIEECDRRGALFVLIKFPEMNLLDVDHVFEPYNEALRRFAEEHASIAYIDGNEVFDGEKPGEFILHKYDGHPNAKAHKRFADAVYAVIADRFPVSRPRQAL